MITEVLQLFEKFRSLLDKEFRNEAVVEWMESQCARINRRLGRRNFYILSANLIETVTAPRTNEITAVVIHYELYLLMLPPRNQTPVGIAHAKSVVWRSQKPNDDSLETVLSRTEECERNATESAAFVWRRYWVFEEKETHAFLTALERHWEKLKKDPHSMEMSISGKETFVQILRSVGTMTPTWPEDVYVFSFLLDREFEYLTGLPTDNELLGCGCEAKDHLQSLEDWEMRNLL